MTVRIPPDEALLNAYTKERESLHADRLRAVATLAAEQAAERAAKEAALRIDARLDDMLSPDGGIRTDLRKWYPSAFTPTPPKEQQPVPSDPVFGPRELPTLSLVQQVKGLRQQLDESREIVKRLSQALADTKRDCPSPDPATVRLDEATIRACIAAINARPDRNSNGFGLLLGHGDAIAALRALLPKPTPAPQPERYITLDEVARVLSGNAEGPLYAALDGGKIEMYLHRLRPLAAKRGPMLTPEQAEEAARKCLGWMESPDPTLLAALHLAAKGEA